MTDLLDRAVEAAGLDRDALARDITRSMASMRSAAALSLTPGEAELLADQPSVGPEELVARSAAGRSALREYLRSHSLPLAEAAARLGVDRSALQHRIARGALAAFDLGTGQRIADWQIVDGALVPHLRAVLAAVRPDMTPLDLARLMTTTHEDLGGLTIPHWLAEGGSPAPVLRIAESTRHR